MAEEIIFKKSKFNIDVEEIDKHVAKGYEASWYRIKFSGDDIYIQMVNSLRRVAINEVPTYAIPVELIKIETNTSTAFNNDYMKLRLGFLPIYGVHCNLSWLDKIYYDKVNFADQTRDKHEDEQLVEIYINSENNTTDNINVTTNDVTMYVDGTKIEPYNRKFPILIIKLRPNEKFKCTMNAVLGIGEMNARWKTVRNGNYMENDKGEFILTLEGNQQSSEYVILIKSCKCLIKKLMNIKTMINTKLHKKELSDENPLKIKLDGEDNTIGEIINYEMQSHTQDILFAGVARTDYYVKTITFTIQTVEKVRPIDLFIESVDLLIKKYSHIGKLLEDMTNTTESSSSSASSKSSNSSDSESDDSDTPIVKTKKKSK